LVARTGFPGTSTTGIVHSASNDNNLPGGWLGHVSVTADQTVTTEAALTGLSQAVTVNTNRRIMIIFDGAYAMSSGSPNRARFRIKEGGTVLKDRMFAAGGNGTEAAHMTVVLTPTSGSHTYNVTLQSQDAGNAVLKADPTGNPAELTILDIGPQS